VSDRCEKCAKVVKIGDHPFCPHGSTLRYRPFIPYDVEIDGGVYRIDGIHTATKLENESMKMYRDGRGAPVVLRAFHQDHSNMNQNVFGAPPRPKFSAVNPRTGKPYITVKKGRLSENE
jgi:hypothetical protein